MSKPQAPPVVKNSLFGVTLHLQNKAGDVRTIYVQKSDTDIAAGNEFEGDKLVTHYYSQAMLLEIIGDNNRSGGKTFASMQKPQIEAINSYEAKSVS